MLLKQGLRIPEDLSLVGFGNILVSEHFQVPLTTIRQPKLRLGIAAIESMLKLLQHHAPGNKRLPAELAIRASSGNSFVHETESQVILNGSRDINFTMDLVVKDVGLFDRLAAEHGVPLELSPLVLRIFQEGVARYGAREHSPNIIRRYEEPCGVKVLGTGFPAAMVDDSPKEPGVEVAPSRG